MTRQGTAFRLTRQQEDALREVASIMVAHAATALGRISARRVDVEIPDIRFVSWQEGAQIASGDTGLVAGVRTRMLGKLAGEVYVTFPRDSALALADILRGLPVGRTSYMSGTAADVLLEVGNIVAGSCLAAFYQFLDISLVHSVPEFVYDTPHALMSPEGRRSTDESVLLAQVRYHSPDLNLSGNLVILFTVESMRALIEALAV